MDFVATLQSLGVDHKVIIGGAVVGLLAYIKRWFDLKASAREKEAEREQARLDKEHANTLARLDLEAQRLVMEQELLAESKKRTTGRATPTGLRHQVVRNELSQTFSGVATEVIDQRIKEHARTASVSVKTIAPSIMPTPSESSQRLAAVKIALDAPPPLPRPSGEHATFGDVFPRDVATLDLSGVSDANESGDDDV